MNDNWKSFGAEFFEALFENGAILVVKAIAAVMSDLSGVKTRSDVGLGDIQNDNRFNRMTGLVRGFNDDVFFAGPAANGGKNQGRVTQVLASEIGEDGVVKDLRWGKFAVAGVVLMFRLFHRTNNHSRREKTGAERFGEFNSLSVFAAHGEAEDVDRAGAEPVFDAREFFVHNKYSLA